MSEAFSPADLLNGWILCGPVPTPIATSRTAFHSGVLLINASEDATICIGANPNVRADPNHAACGIPLRPGSSVVIPVADLSRLYAVCDDTAKLFFMGA